MSSNPSNPDIKVMMKINIHTIRTLKLIAPRASYLDTRKV